MVTVLWQPVVALVLKLQYQSGPALVTHNGCRQGAARAVPADQFSTLLNSVTGMASQETDLPDAPGADSDQDTEARRLQHREEPEIEQSRKRQCDFVFYCITFRRKFTM